MNNLLCVRAPARTIIDNFDGVLTQSERKRKKNTQLEKKHQIYA